MWGRIFGRSGAWAPLVLRLAAGSVFIGHGAQKLFGAFDGPGLTGFASFLAGLGLKPALAWAILVAVVEFFGGACLVLGVLTRLWALLLSVVMLVAIFGVHFRQGFFGFEFPLVLLGACVSLLMTGGGRAALKD
ncbi:MAG TPA: DoxX family protein [bacterium]|nr:DoxX family protein [bacterium]HPQ65238.1 DoxX family protein [bacterium]